MAPYLPVGCGLCGTKNCGCDKSISLYRVATPRSWGVDMSEPLSMVIRRFYGALACHALTGNRQARDAVIEPVAKSLLAATMLSCAGEARYVAVCAMHQVMLRAKRAYTDDELWKQSPLGRLAESLIKKAPLEMMRYVQPDQNYPKSRITGATSLRGAKLYKKNDPARAAHVLRSAFILHEQMHPASVVGYGGHTWGYAAELAYQYAAGKISAIHFVDTILDMVHNNGFILDKVWQVTATTRVVLELRRRASAPVLALYAPSDVREAFGLLPIEVEVPSWLPFVDARLLDRKERPLVYARAAERGLYTYLLRGPGGGFGTWIEYLASLSGITTGLKECSYWQLVDNSPSFPERSDVKAALIAARKEQFRSKPSGGYHIDGTSKCFCIKET